MHFTKRIPTSRSSVVGLTEIRNVLDKVKKADQPAVKASLHENPS